MTEEQPHKLSHVLADLIAACLKIIGKAIVSAFGSTILNAYVFMLLWQWFIHPPGLPIIGYFHAAGLFLTVSIITFTVRERDDENRVLRQANYLANAIFLPITLLVIGVVCRVLMEVAK